MESAKPGWFDEDAHHFNFDAFYQKAEFCDRSVRLEILEECRIGCEEAQANATCTKEVDAQPLAEETPKAIGQAPDDSGQEPKASEETPEEANQEEPTSSQDAPNTSREQPTNSELLSDSAKGTPDTSAQVPGTSQKVPETSQEPPNPSTEAPKQSGELPNVAREEPEKESVERASEEASGKKRKAEEEPPRGSKKLSKEDAVPEKQARGLEEAAPKDEWVEDIPVNSVILAAKSSVLRTMLSNGMKETDKGNPIVLKVTPEEKVAIKEMLHFLYAGCLSDSFSSPETDVRSLVDLLAVGDKFEVRSFMGAVLHAPEQRVEIIQDCEVLGLHMPEILEQHHMPIKELTAKARDHLLNVFQKADEWQESEAFLSLGQDTVRFLLQSEELEADSEEDIFKRVLAWVRMNIEGVTDRGEAMCNFSEHIRFACMKGEFLDQEVLPLDEMSLPKCQKVAQKALRLQAFSEEVKAEWRAPILQLRRGIRAAHLEITFDLEMTEDEDVLLSPSAEWLGFQWRLMLQKQESSDPPLVGVFLESKGTEGTKMKVDHTFYVRTWPSGYWKRIHKRLTDTEFSGTESECWGYSDAVGLSWDEARKSKTYISSTGQISFKVLVYKRSITKGINVGPQ